MVHMVLSPCHDFRKFILFFSTSLRINVYYNIYMYYDISGRLYTCDQIDMLRSPADLQRSATPSCHVISCKKLFPPYIRMFTRMRKTNFWLPMFGWIWQVIGQRCYPAHSHRTLPFACELKSGPQPNSAIKYLSSISIPTLARVSTFQMRPWVLN